MAFERQVASFFDAENIKASWVDSVQRDLLQRGRLLIRKAYGDFQSTQLKAWIPVCKQFAIDMVSRSAVASGKNASDIAMCIDAMECLVTRTNIDTFALVTSDSDCTPLALRLREHGKFVLGFGQESSPPAFRQACDEFIVLEPLKWVNCSSGDSGSPDAAHGEVPRGESDGLSGKFAAHDAVRQAFNELAKRHGGAGAEEGWVDTDHLLNYMVRLQTDFSSLLSSWGCKWIRFLREDAYFELHQDKSGTGYNHYIRRSAGSSEGLLGEPEPEVRPQKAGKRKRAHGETVEPGDDVESNKCERLPSTKGKRAKKGAEGRDPTSARPTLKKFRLQVWSLLKAKGANFVKLRWLSKKMGPKTVRSTLKTLGYKRLSEFCEKMKRIELVVQPDGKKKVRLQQ